MEETFGILPPNLGKFSFEGAQCPWNEIPRMKFYKKSFVCQIYAVFLRKNGTCCDWKICFFIPKVINRFFLSLLCLLCDQIGWFEEDNHSHSVLLRVRHAWNQVVRTTKNTVTLNLFNIKWPKHLLIKQSKDPLSWWFMHSDVLNAF